ncbi:MULTISPECIES: hypothetical protein [Streptomyces]
MVRASSLPGPSGQRAANFRMIALASAVVLAVVLPLAVATAGPAGRAKERAGRAPQGRSGSGTGPAARAAALRPMGGARGAGAEHPGDADGWDGPALGLSAMPGLTGPAAGAGGVSRCGPELTSPEGVEAQTCVLGQDRETWGRTYYRNATGAPLTGVLSLMSPDGRTMQVNCRLAATDDPDMCETPHRATVRGHGSYAAVAEIASTEGKLLLRSGSNSPEDDAG